METNMKIKKKKKAAPPPPPQPKQLTQQQPQQHHEQPQQPHYQQQPPQQPLPQQQPLKQQQRQIQPQHEQMVSPTIPQEHRYIKNQKALRTKPSPPSNISKSTDQIKTKDQNEDNTSKKYEDKKQDRDSGLTLGKELRNPLVKKEPRKNSKSKKEEIGGMTPQIPLVAKELSKPKKEKIIDEDSKSKQDKAMPTFSMSKKVIGKIELPKDRIIIEATDEAPDEEELIDNYALFSMDDPPEDLVRTTGKPMEEETNKKIERKENKKKSSKKDKQKTLSPIVEKELTDKEKWITLLSTQESAPIEPEHPKRKPISKPIRKSSKQKDNYQIKPFIEIDRRAKAVKAPNIDQMMDINSEQVRKNLKVGSIEPEQEGKMFEAVELDIDFEEDLLPITNDYDEDMERETNENEPEVTSISGVNQFKKKEQVVKTHDEEKLDKQEFGIIKTDESFASVYFG